MIGQTAAAKHGSFAYHLAILIGQPLRKRLIKPRLHWVALALFLLAALEIALARPLAAQEAETVAPQPTDIADSVEEAPADVSLQAPPATVAPASNQTEAQTEAATPAPTRRKGENRCKPDVGCVTGQPLPRFVSLKGDEGNARRGPGLTHRIDWVFTRPGMPLRVTAEYENWRRIEDQDGASGWMHYAMLSGVRYVTIIQDMAELRSAPNPTASVVAQAEMGVVARLQACNLDWCRISAGGERGWVTKTALWGVTSQEILE